MDEALTENERLALAEIEALMLRAMLREPVPHKQIARRLNMSNGDVWNTYQRALAKIRKYAQKGAE
jgi:DNA-directed RNA polymerase specialized sigma24 family protein